MVKLFWCAPLDGFFSKEFHDSAMCFNSISRVGSLYTAYSSAALFFRSAISPASLARVWL